MMERRQRRKYEEIEFDLGEDPFVRRYFLEEQMSSGTYLTADQREISLTNSVYPLTNPRISKKTRCNTPDDYFKILSNYIDFLFTSPTDSIYLHILNHIYKSKRQIIRNNESEDPVKDQGFTSATVLIVQPSKASCKELVKKLIEFHCLGKRKKVPRRKKFKEVFEEESDCFKIGISLGDKRQLNLFSPFLSADIIVGSPLALNQLISEHSDSSFLSSIEVVLIEDAHEILMQNWDHLEHIVKSCNLLPVRDSITNDINRIKECFVEGNSADFRQMIVTTSFLTPLIISLFNRNPNKRGKIKTLDHFKSILPKGIPQQFRKFSVMNIDESADKRFDYFVTVYWPLVKENLLGSSIIFVSNYAEYLRLKTYFEINDPLVSCVCEYSKKSDRQRALSLLKNDKFKALCLTERLLHFRKINFKRIGNLIVYSLPDNCDFYTNLANNASEVQSLFCKFDGYSLQRIVGDKLANKLLGSHNDIFSLR